MKDPIVPDVLSPEAADASREAIHAAKNAAQALEAARTLQMASFKEETREETRDVFVKAIQEAFGDYTEQQRFIDLKRVPLICKQIENIHENIQEMKDFMEKRENRYVNIDQFWPVKTLVYGVTGLILAGVFASFLALVIR